MLLVCLITGCVVAVWGFGHNYRLRFEISFFGICLCFMGVVLDFVAVLCFCCVCLALFVVVLV